MRVAPYGSEADTDIGFDTYAFDTPPAFAPTQVAVPAAFLAWCLASDWTKYRIVHPVYAIGGALLLISLPLRFMIAQTPAWERVGRWLAGMQLRPDLTNARCRCSRRSA
jgi:hypothetical protein